MPDSRKSSTKRSATKTAKRTIAQGRATHQTKRPAARPAVRSTKRSPRTKTSTAEKTPVARRAGDLSPTNQRPYLLMLALCSAVIVIAACVNFLGGDPGNAAIHNGGANAILEQGRSDQRASDSNSTASEATRKKPKKKPKKKPEPKIPATPHEQWRAGEVPYIYQTDKQWADKPYAGNIIKKAGCGPTCLTMVYIALTGDTTVDPVSMAKFSEDNGYVQQGMTAWALMERGARSLGLSSRTVNGTEASVTQALENGELLIFSVRPGDFTDVGHFIVVSGLWPDGTLQVHDPNSPVNSAKHWGISRVLEQTSNIWAFSK